MAFPVVNGRSGGLKDTASTTSPVTLPSGVVSGELLVVFIAWRGSGTPTATAGWTLLGTRYDNTTSLAVFYKTVTGSDALTVTHASSRSSHLSYRISGFAGISGTSAASAGGGANAGDPPNHTPSGGAKDFLWLAAIGRGGILTAPGAPTGYSNLQSRNTAASQGASTHCAELALNAASENPSPFTGTSTNSSLWTVAIEPVAGGGGITAAASITEDPDTVSSSGVLPIAGTASVTEAADALSASSKIAITASASITESDDTLTAIGTAVAPAIVGTASITEASDTVSATGELLIEGAASITEAGDTVTSAARLAISATAAITEANDTVASSSRLSIKGVASITETGDTVSATGTTSNTIFASANITEANDNASSNARLYISGNAAISEDSDTLFASGSNASVQRRFVAIIG